MKKLFIVATLAIGTAAFSQTGKVGVNETAPQTTLDIKPNAANAANNATTIEGVLIPRVSRLRASNMGASVPESTLVYINSVADGDTTGTTVHVDTSGYYYFTGGVWVKLGAGTGTAATVVSAQNGLTLNATAVELGGTLKKNTNIAQAGFNLTTTGNGNFGIGTSTPTGKLVVVGSSSSYGTIRVQSDDSVQPAEIGFTLFNTNLDQSWTVGVNPAIGDGTSLVHYYQGPRTVLTRNGDFGIGAAYPQARLDVEGTVRIADVGTTNSTSNQVLVRDTTSGLVGYRDASSLAGNTLTNSTSNIISGTTVERAALTGDVTAAQNSNATTVTGIQGKTVSSTAPTIGQTLIYNGTNWVPGTEGTFTRNVRITDVTAETVLNSDYYIRFNGSNQTVTFPNPNNFKGRVICLSNMTSEDLNLTPTNFIEFGVNNIIRLNGTCFISVGSVWTAFGRL